MFGTYLSHALKQNINSNYRFLSSKADVILPGFNEAACLFYNHVKNKPKIALYYDPDIDGIFSGLLFEWFLGSSKDFNKNLYSELKKNYKVFLNDNRQHGPMLSEEDLISLQGYLLVVVDSAIEPKLYYSCLEHNISIIVLDHHEINVSDYISDSKDFVFTKVDNAVGVIVNNQYPNVDEAWQFLSGAGVVHQFLKYIQKDFTLVSDSAALVGITLLSDVRELNSPYAKRYLTATFQEESEYLNFLIKLVTPEAKQVGYFGVPKLTRGFIDFTFSPCINAALRANMGKLVLDTLRGYDEEITKSVISNNYLLSFKEAQQAIIEKIFLKRQELLNEPNLTNDYPGFALTVIDVSNNFTISNYTGVFASKFVSTTSGLVLCIKDGQVVRGSFRGHYSSLDYLSLFKSLGIPVGGHGSAFGIQPCSLAIFNFDALSEKLLDFENQCFAKGDTGDRRIICSTGNMGMFIRTPLYKLISLYNAYVRDMDRIYVDYTGSKENVEESVKSAKYKTLNVDGVIVTGFGARALDNSYILCIEEGKFNSCVLSPSFNGQHSEDILVSNLMQFQNQICFGG